ncbi:MAG: hypothetical protein OXU71_13035 [Gammaproteobacteria bacterium]|nr:hypothetical protein [Gammaproteobacteria bacterium]
MKGWVDGRAARLPLTVSRATLDADNITESGWAINRGLGVGGDGDGGGGDGDGAGDGALSRHPRSLLSGGGGGDGALSRHPRSLLSGGGDGALSRHPRSLLSGGGARRRTGKVLTPSN